MSLYFVFQRIDKYVCKTNKTGEKHLDLLFYRMFNLNNMPLWWLILNLGKNRNSLQGENPTKVILVDTQDKVNKERISGRMQPIPKIVFQVHNPRSVGTCLHTVTVPFFICLMNTSLKTEMAKCCCTITRINIDFFEEAYKCN